ncbi:MAG: outer membrane beta-barrel protein [Sphingobacteriales bacterium]|nr:outer membrane beta-barrel protein [Sphingobacteriales bacterium]
MKEQFDKELRNHIRDTFDHFDDQLAEDGWQKFKTQKRRKKRGLIFWYALPGGIAASLALLWLVNIYISTPNPINQPEIAHSKSDSIKPLNPQNEEQHKSIASLNSKEFNQASSEKSLSSENTLVTYEKPSSTSESLERSPNSSKIAQLNTVLSGVKVIKKPNTEAAILANKTSSLTVSPVSSMELASTTFDEQIAEIDAQEKGLTLANIDPQPIPILFLAQEAEQKTAPTAKKNKLKVALDANTFMNYSEAGLNNQLNLGIGMSTNLKISKHLSLNSGILLNRQTSTFDGNNKVDAGFKLSNFSTMVSVPKSQITNAKLVGLDIPLNLRFSMNMGKTRTFLSTGFSSYSVINERYVNDYSVVNYSITGIRANRITTVQNNPTGSFSYFKFAQSLNLSFGVLYPLSKNSTLSVEPFMKYPLTGLGYQDLLIGAGGVSFKLNFGH